MVVVKVMNVRLQEAVDVLETDSYLKENMDASYRYMLISDRGLVRDHQISSSLR